MNILIVDDNKYVVESLKKRLNWEAFGIHQVFGCYGVEQAEEILSGTEIDFLITDIEMPEKNGFELLEWISGQGMNLEKVLLTSYADFVYAKLAVKYQCVEYLLKPVDRKALEDVVNRMVGNRIEYYKKQRLEEYGNNWLSHQNLVKEMFWRDVLSEEVEPREEALLRRIRKEDLPYSGDSRFAAVLICLEEREEFSRALLLFSCENVMEEIAGIYHMPFEFFSYNGYFQFAAVFCIENEQEYEVTGRIMAQFLDVFIPFYHAGITCYISDVVAMAELTAHFRKLEEYFLDNLNRENGIFSESVFLDRQEVPYIAPEFEEWKELIHTGKTDVLERQVHGYFEKLRSSQVIDNRLLQAVMAEWNNLEVAISKENNITTYQLMTRFRNQELAEMSIRSVASLERLIVSEAHLIAEQISYIAQPDAMIEDMKAYVRTHLDGVTRSDISNEFFVSPNYLSKLFRRETGMSLSEYIQKERMQQAKHLLLQNEMSISQIAEQVGYPSFAHFSKQFKKMNGMTPNEYRKRIEQ